MQMDHSTERKLTPSATATDWNRFATVLGLTADMLPIIGDPNVAMHGRSSIKAPDGKTPSTIDAQGFGWGLAGWTGRTTTPSEVSVWSRDRRLSIGLVARRVKAIDVDIADPERAADVAELIGYAATLPTRRRPNSGKFLQPFRCEVDFPKRVIKTPFGNIELLSNKQQFVIAGRHPSGVHYEWIDADGEPGLPDDIGEMSLAEVDVLWQALIDQFGTPDGASEARAGMAPTAPRRAVDGQGDPRIAYLDAAGWVLSHAGDGRASIRCPFEDGHTPGTGGETSTIVFPAGVGGFDQGHYRCLHASCAKRTDQDFDAATGYTRAEFDVIMLDAAQQADAAIARAANAEKAARVELDDFFAYGPDHKFIYRPTRAMWPAASVDGMVSPWPKVGDKPMAPSRWLDRNRAVQQMSWLPGEPELIKDLVVLESGFASRAGARVFNRYVPPAPYTGDAALAGPWLDHLKLIYPDDWSHLLHWFAHRMQRPGEKVNHALVLGGTQGIGKDSVLVPVKVGAGACNVQDIAPGALLGSFNGFVASVLLVVSEARDLGDSDRFKLYEHCKTLTAAPPDVLRVNEKHLREYYVPNLVGVIFTTNHRTSGLYLPAEDRRHYVAWSEATPAQLGADYFKRLYRWYEAGGVGHVLAYLHALDLSRFNAKAEPPKTEAFWALVHAGESPESNELRDAINACGLAAAVTVRMVREAALRVGLDDLAAQLFDPKTRARLPHMFERVGYVAVRNPDSKADGRFGKETVYADAKLTRSAQILAARSIPPPTKAQKTAGSTASDFA